MGVGGLGWSHPDYVDLACGDSLPIISSQLSSSLPKPQCLDCPSPSSCPHSLGVNVFATSTLKNGLSVHTWVVANLLRNMGFVHLLFISIQTGLSFQSISFCYRAQLDSTCVIRSCLSNSPSGCTNADRFTTH